MLRLQERLSKESEAEREAMLNLTREKEGARAELVKLEEQGIRPSQQLREIFAKQARPTRAKRD